MAFVSTPLVPPCKCWATEWLSAESSRANRICNKQTSTFDAKNWLTQSVMSIWGAGLGYFTSSHRGWVRIRCPMGPTDSLEWLTLDHCSSSAFSHCHKSFGHRCPQLCFRRHIYRICDPSAIRSLIWADPCDRICRPVPAR